MGFSKENPMLPNLALGRNKNGRHLTALPRIAVVFEVIMITETGTSTSLAPHLKRLDMPSSKQETGELQSRCHALDTYCDWAFPAWQKACT